MAMASRHRAEHKPNRTIDDQDIQLEDLSIPAGDHTSTTSEPLLEQKVEVSPKGWPNSPKPVESAFASTVSDMVVDIALLALCLAFLAFGLTVLHYDQASTEAHPRITSALLEATRYGPTVFPILFAATVGRAAHAILVWRLEKGARIGVLDMLAGSTSLTGTVTSQLRLRIISFLGLALIVVWALSPIGGQASLRQMTLGTALSTKTTAFSYMFLRGNLSGFDDSDRVSNFAIVNSLFIASLLAPLATKHSSLDTWSNVKIPLIEQYEGAGAPDSQGWFDANDAQSVYASLIGLPFVSNSTSAPVDYNISSIQTSYLYLDCPVVNGTYTANFPNTSIVGTSSVPRNFSYFSWGPTGYSTCTLTTTYVEVDIKCPASSPCAPSRLRRSPYNNPSPGFTLLDLPAWAGSSNWDIFCAEFVAAIQGHPATATVVQSYLIAPDNPLGVSIYGQYDNTFQPVPAGVYSVRLGQLMNAYWTCMNAMYAITGGMTFSTAWMADTTTPLLIGEEDFRAGSSNTTGTETTAYPVIVAHHGWIAALLISSFLLIAASLVHPLVRGFLCRGANIMLNKSSLATRNNAYITVPDNGTFLAASDRAKLLKDLKVRFGDVEAGSDVGELAVASCDTRKIANVRKGRLYK